MTTPTNTPELSLDEQQFLMWLETKTQAVFKDMTERELQFYVNIFLYQKDTGVIDAN